MSADTARGLLQIGSPRWIASLSDRAGVNVVDMAETSTNSSGEEGYTSAKVAVDGIEVAELLLTDEVFGESANMLRTLRQMGWSTAILSGDSTQAVTAVANELGFTRQDAYAEMTPEAKLCFALKATQPSTRQADAVVMIGGGVNDAATLAAADVGIAVHGGAEAALVAADIYISEPGLGALLTLM